MLIVTSQFTVWRSLNTSSHNLYTTFAEQGRLLFQLKDACSIFFEKNYAAARYTLNALGRPVDDDPGAHDRRYSCFEDEVLRGVYPLATMALLSTALTVVRPMLNLSDFNLMGLEVQVIVAAASLFAPVGRVITEQTLATAVPGKEVISSLFEGTATVLIPAPNSQCVDLYVLWRSKRSAGGKIHAAAIQVTANPHHDASHETFATLPQSFLGNKTMLQALREHGVNGRIDFVYITNDTIGLIGCFAKLPRLKTIRPQVKGTPLQLLLERSSGFAAVNTAEYTTLLQARLCIDDLWLHAQCRDAAQKSPH